MRELKFDLTVDSSSLLCPNSQDFYSKAYITPVIASNFYVLPGVKASTKISTVAFDNILKASSCNFAAGDQILSGITVEVCPISALAEICRFDLEQSFVALQMVQGANANWEVASFMDFYWSEMAQEIQAELAQIMWRGNTTNPAFSGSSSYLALCDGYEKKLAADTTVIDVTASATTVATVLANMTAVFNALPAVLKNKLSDLRFYVSPDIALAYRIAAAQGNTQAYVTESLRLSFLGVELVVQEGLTANRMVLTRKQNLIYAFDGEGDATQLKAINLEDTVAEPVLRTRVNLKAGFYHVNGKEIVFFN
jgi:hypothetical protein